ncbi:MAG: hypothetical protein AAF988_07520 [Pseudomonadota bacterium]
MNIKVPDHVRDTIAAWKAIGDQKKRTDAANGVTVDGRTQEEVAADLNSGQALPADHLRFK